MPMNNFTKVLLLVLLLVYVVSPLDLVPGPIDDVLVILLCFAANRSRTALEKRDTEMIDVVDVDGTEPRE